MFWIFKKKDPVEALQKKYEKLLAEAHKWSHTDRKKSDLLTAEADEVIKKIEQLRKRDL